jgi:hypothetical protein
MGVHLPEPLDRGSHLGRAEVVLGVEELAGQVARLHRVEVDAVDGADACSHE